MGVQRPTELKTKNSGTMIVQKKVWGPSMPKLESSKTNYIIKPALKSGLHWLENKMVINLQSKNAQTSHTIATKQQ